MARLVLIDASPLIGLTIVDGLAWLKTLFGVVWMPEEVRREVLSGKVERGEKAISAAIEAGWISVWPETVESLEFLKLDEGETACITIGVNHPEDVLLIMDERAGRATAIENGLKVTGTAAIIGMAKTKGLIPSARKVFEILHQSDFRISTDVIKTILEMVGET